jgi:cysteinyl-tRNA synthetase
VATLQQHWQTLDALARVLGLEVKPAVSVTDTVAPAGAVLGTSSGVDMLEVNSDAEIEALIQQRQEARKAKNFAESDRIRNDLQEKGITLIDQAGGITRWHRS